MTPAPPTSDAHPPTSDELVAALRAAVGGRERLRRVVDRTVAPSVRAWEKAEKLTLRLAEASDSDRDQILLDLVRSTLAAAVRDPSARAISPDLPFREMAFDSLSAVRLRIRLVAATNLFISPSLVFEHPTCNAVAHYLGQRLNGVPDEPADQRHDEAREELHRLHHSGLVDDVIRLAATQRADVITSPADERLGQVDQMDVGELMSLARDPERSEL
jgi:Phosphopantetheine attachment site